FHYPTPTANYTLSLHDALPISKRHPEVPALELAHAGEDVPPELVAQGDHVLGQQRLAVLGRARAPLQQADVVEQHPPALVERQRSEEHTFELQSRGHLVCRLLL